MKRIAPILALTILFACAEKKNEKSDDIQNQSEVSKSNTETKEKQIEYQVDLTLKPIKSSDLPEGVTYKGDFVSAESWLDKNGENIIVRSISPNIEEENELNPGDDCTTAKIFAGHYVKENGSWKLLWDMNDSEKKCEFDLSMGYVAKDLIVLDENKDDVAESYLVYAKACRSDVSPATMKIIIHEGERKLALRGSMQDVAVEGEPQPLDINDLNFEALNLDPKAEDFDYMEYFGRYQSEKDFEEKDSLILKQAKQIWQKCSVLDHKF